MRSGCLIYFVILSASLLIGGCAPPAANNATNLSTNTNANSNSAAVTATVPNGDWPGYNRTLDSQRFSPLDQINPQNVASLKQVCTYDLGEASNFQSGLAVADNSLYATTETQTIALDPSTCTVKWKVQFDKPATEGLRVNRGVAYADGKLFRGYNDGSIVALDAATGQRLWATKIADPAKGESVPAAPIAWNGMVFIGQAGGDNKGVRGRMMAVNAADGKQLWSFDLIPLEGPGSETWPPNNPDQPRTGGATWTSYTLDPVSGQLYVPVGNAAPDFDIKARPGLNLYTNSIVILDAKTGTFKEHYQLTPNDFHDWDMAATPTLVKTTGGKNLIVAAGKDGVVHAVDPAQKSEVYKTPVTTIENADVALSEDKETHFCPGVQGGVEWNGPSFSPAANMIFTNSIDWCYSLKLFPEQLKGKPATPFTGGTDTEQPFGRVDPKEKWKGYVTAINADDGTVKWKYQSPTPMVAGITSTAGGLVFTADLNGTVMAFNAADGTQLWKADTRMPVGGGVISYLANNKQYIAVAAGITSQSWQTKGSNATVLVFGLP